MIPIREHASSSTAAPVSQRRVHVASDRDLEALHATRERGLVLGLDEQMHVRALDADVDHANAFADRSHDRRVAYGLVQTAAPQAADGGHHAQRDVLRVASIDRRPRLVRRASAPMRWLAPGALAPPTVTKQLLLDMPFPTSPRHAWYLVFTLDLVKLISPR